ncbi:hypothetical protein [Kribbella sp. NPDC049584]|uniref:hypothetical protein n=1 Tax=Kribbella sp. NPDC049584 TaxID=3154833 RepID=UPI003443C3F6
MPSREQANTEADRRIVGDWISANRQAHARLTEVEDPDEPGRVVLVVNVPDRDEMIRAREELADLMRCPEQLRVRRWKPSRAEIDSVQAWVWNTNRPHLGRDTQVVATWIDVWSGLLSISLNRIDRKYADELEAATDGLAFVRPEPDTGTMLGPRDA